MRDTRFRLDLRVTSRLRTSMSKRTVGNVPLVWKRLAWTAGYVVVRCGRLKNARRRDICCSVSETTVSGCKGFTEGLHRRGKAGIDGNRCTQSVKYRNLRLAAVVSANDEVPHKFCTIITVEER